MTELVLIVEDVGSVVAGELQPVTTAARTKANTTSLIVFIVTVCVRRCGLSRCLVGYFLDGITGLILSGALVFSRNRLVSVTGL